MSRLPTRADEPGHMVRRGEVVLDVPVDGAEARHVLAASTVPLRVTAVLDGGGHRQTRTRSILLTP